MRVVRNIGYVKQQRRRSKLFAVVGLLLVFVSFGVTLWQGTGSTVFLMYSLLFAGFMLFNRGMRGLGRWSHNARHIREDLALDEKLSSLPDRLTTVHYGKLDKSIAEHVIVHPGGVLVVTAKDFPGAAKVSGDRWKRQGSGFSRVFSFGGPQVGNPTAELRQSTKIVERALEQAEIDAPVQSAIVFTAPTAEIEVESSTEIVLTANELSRFVTELPAKPPLTPAQRDAIVALLAQGDEVERSEPAMRRRPVRVNRRTT